MKILKYLGQVIPVLFFLTQSDHLKADACSSDTTELCFDGGEAQYLQDLDEKDWDSLYDYINTKRTINVQEKACNLTISGDVRAEYRRLCETGCHGEALRGENARDRDGNRRGHTDFNVQFNLRFDYVCNRAWAVAHLQFDNQAGVCNDYSAKEYSPYYGQKIFIDPHGMNGSGTGCDIDLKKAYFGYNIYCDGATRIDTEVGRRRIYQIFDSEIQFLSRFDGILVKFDHSVDCFADCYLHAVGFVVDFKSTHYAWGGEVGLLDLFDTGIDFKYSLIDWRKNGENFQGQQDPLGSRFVNSQFTACYNFDPELFCVPAKIFGACLINHDAVPLNEIVQVYPSGVFEVATDEEEVAAANPSAVFVFPDLKHKANFAWYAGITIGEVVGEGDWAFSGQYQWVEAQSIPNNDVSGIGLGNVNRCTFTKDYQGNTNFKGYRLQVLYAYTDNLSFDLRLDRSKILDTNISGDHTYSQVRLEAIYAF